jgi:hypothetical protein
MHDLDKPPLGICASHPAAGVKQMITLPPYNLPEPTAIRASRSALAGVIMVRRRLIFNRWTDRRESAPILTSRVAHGLWIITRTPGDTP